MNIYSDTNYRRIYEQHYGPIPKDNEGRSYEIHHIDGNHYNNNIDNLKLVTIQEHYDIHYAQGDWAACHKISGRMNLSPDIISDLATRRNLLWVANGTHPFSKRPDGSSIASDRVKSGSHNFLGGDISRGNNRRRVDEGTHNFLGKKLNQKRIDEGTHNFVGEKNPSHKRITDGTHNFLNLIQDGKHPSQIKRTCEHCGKTVPSTMFGRWHGDKCRHKEN